MRKITKKAVSLMLVVLVTVQMTVPVNAAPKKSAKSSATAFAMPGYIPLGSLPSYSRIKKKATANEMELAYYVAGSLMLPLQSMTREQQIVAVYQILRDMVDSGLITYAIGYPHYNDPYGYFVSGVASCAGSTRATIMCLEMLGFQGVEHVHPEQYCHQWVRVPMADGSVWICDPFGMYVGPEPAPYVHPYAQ